jgi:hypothetical protein
MVYKRFGAYKPIGILKAKASNIYDVNGSQMPNGTVAYDSDGLGDNFGAFVPNTTIVATGGKVVNTTNQRACSWALRALWTASNSTNRIMLAISNSGGFLQLQPEFPTAGRMHITFDGAGAIEIGNYSLNTWYRYIITSSDNGSQSVYNIWQDGVQVVTNALRNRGANDYSEIVTNSSNVARVTNRNGGALSGCRVSNIAFFDKTLNSDEVARIDRSFVGI